MQTRQAKSHSPNTAPTKTAESPQKVAVSAASASHVPAWAGGMNDQIPPGLVLQDASAIPGLQAKLAISQPNDPYEQEADRIAEQVMRTPASPAPIQIQRKCSCGGMAGPMGECEACAARRKALQRQATKQASGSTAPPIVNQVLSSGNSQPLDAETRAFMEPRFGTDFSQVRVHTGGQATESAQSVNALAYTVGNDVVFGSGQYRPETGEGQRLLAHELMHVVQQGNVRSHQSGIQRKPSTKKPAQLPAEGEKKDSKEKISQLVDDIYDIVQETMVVHENRENELVFKEHWIEVENRIIKLQGKLFPELGEKDMLARLRELTLAERMRVRQGVLDRLVQSSGQAADIDYHKEFTTALSDRTRRYIEEGEAGFISVRGALLNTFGSFLLANMYYDALVKADFPPHSTVTGKDTLVHRELKKRLDRAAALLDKKGILEDVSKSINHIGGFNIRENRNNKKTKGGLVNLSKHSFGWAIDIDDNYNPNMPPEKFPRALVKELTGEDIYTGKAAETLRARGAYDPALEAAKRLRTVSDEFKADFDDEKSLEKALINYVNTHGAKLTLDKGKALLDLLEKIPANIRTQAHEHLTAQPKKHEEKKGKAKQEKSQQPTPKQPEVKKQPESYQTLLKWLSDGGVSAQDTEHVATVLLEAYRVFLGSRYAKDVKGHKKGEKIKSETFGTPETVAAQGFINLRPELIAALVSEEGGGLKWLGAVEVDTKDFMHFELAPAPVLEKRGDFPMPEQSQPTADV